jgi:hypothetical protein
VIFTTRARKKSAENIEGADGSVQESFWYNAVIHTDRISTEESKANHDTLTVGKSYQRKDA